MRKSIFSLALACLLGSGSLAQASMMTSNVSHTLSKTDWTDTFAIAKFNTALGTLTSIKFDLSGYTTGILKAESDNTVATNVTLILESLLKLTRADMTFLVDVDPFTQRMFSFTAYDGVDDFGGTSGASTGNITSAVVVDSYTSALAADLASFSTSGSGTVNVLLEATGKSKATGSGNLTTKFTTNATADVAVTYIYTAASTSIPEPESTSMLLGGLGLIGFMARRRKAT